MTVVWSQVCVPTEESGLGIRNLFHRNRVALLKTVRSIVASSSVWHSLSNAFFGGRL